jgi:hypothetical protein
MKSVTKKTTTEIKSVKRTPQVRGRKVVAPTSKKEPSAPPFKRPKSSKSAKRKRSVKNPHIAQLGALQKQFVISIPSKDHRTFVERMERFVPENPNYWVSVEKAKSSREKYVAGLFDPDRLTKRVAAINRGARLVFSAASWNNPTAGPKENISMARGQQWRMAMAWTGCELLCDSLFPRIKDFDGDVISEWCRILGLDQMNEMIPVPRGLMRSDKTRSLWKEEVAILDFLGVRGGRPRTILNGWWINKNPILTYGSALHATRGLRDVTMHGLMSANRVEKFGLSTVGREEEFSILDRLVGVTVDVTVATMRRLLEK